MLKTLAMMTYLFGGAESHQLPMQITPAVALPTGAVPSTYTCHGEHQMIPLKWQHVPVGTKSLAILMYEKQSGSSKRYLLGIYDIPPEKSWLDSMAIRHLRGVHVVQNSWGHVDYDAPCPSLNGSGQYVVELYALRARFYFQKPVTVGELQQAMQHRVIASAKLEFTISPALG